LYSMNIKQVDQTLEYKDHFFQKFNKISQMGTIEIQTTQSNNTLHESWEGTKM